MLTPKLLHFDIPDPAQPASRHRIACYQWGNPDATETVICVHGLTRNSRDFDTLARELANVGELPNFRVLCPDITGRGVSPWLKNPLGYNNAAYVADMAWILRALHIPKVHWIGTSMGGIMGMMMANSNPGVIKSLVLNDIGCFIPAQGLQRLRGLADLKTSYKTRLEAEEAYWERCANFGITNEEHWQHLFTYGLREQTNGTTTFTYDPAIFKVAFPGDIEIADVDLWPLWPAVDAVPVLLIRGADSDILLRRTAIEMQLRHHDLQLHEVENTGHAPMLMEDKENALIHEWISAKLETP